MSRMRSTLAGGIFAVGVLLACVHGRSEEPRAQTSEQRGWQRIGVMPGAERAQGEAPQTRWRAGELWVVEDDGVRAVFSPSTGAWRVPEEPHERIEEADVSPARLDLLMGSGPYQEPGRASGYVAGAGGVELEPRLHAPRAFFALNQFAGARLRVDGGAWIELPAAGAPRPRRPGSYAMVRAGEEVLVWGGMTEEGLTAAGARFDLRERRWRPISRQGAPTPRRNPRVVTWTGDEFIVWGGRGAGGDIFDGARYDPVEDAWSPMAVEGAPQNFGEQAVVMWTGEHLIYLPTAARGAEEPGGVYSPRANTWRRVVVPQALYPTYKVRAWRADDGRVVLAKVDGPWVGVLDPRRGSWVEPEWSETGLSARQEVHVRWTGGALVLWGGVRRELVMPGGGCEGPRPPGVGCDPMPPVYATQVLLDGALYRPPKRQEP